MFGSGARFGCSETNKYWCLEYSVWVITQINKDKWVFGFLWEETRLRTCFFFSYSDGNVGSFHVFTPAPGVFTVYMSLLSFLQLLFSTTLINTQKCSIWTPRVVAFSLIFNYQSLLSLGGLSGDLKSFIFKIWSLLFLYDVCCWPLGQVSLENEIWISTSV